MKAYLNNFFKCFMFVVIFMILFYLFTYLTIPKYNVGDFYLSDIANYSILSEEKNTIDVIALGDSLIYSSVSPMEIYGEYGITVFDCADAAQLLPTTMKNLDLAIRSQHPKMIIIEPSVFFRDERKADFGKKYVDKLRKFFSLIQTHNNWKKLLTRKSNQARWVNVEKGYKYNDKIIGIQNLKQFEYTEKEKKFPYKNLDYFYEVLKICEENNVKIVFFGFPSRKTWSYARHNYITRLAKENNIEYYNLNFDDSVFIDWTVDTKDAGNHLNYTGAKKVSSYVGKYLQETGLFKDHRKDKKYEAWNIAYKTHLKTISENNH